MNIILTTDGIAEMEADHFQWFTPSREEWLRQASVKMAGWLAEIDLQLDPSIAPVSVGFPKIAHGKGKAIGVCHVRGACPADERLRPIFICPTLGDAVMDVLPTLLHELAHAALPPETGHRKPFADAMIKLGLAGKPTETFLEAGSPLHARMVALAADLGPYPHVAMADSKRTRTKTWVRMISLTDPEYRIDINMDILADHGAPMDPWGERMVLSEKAKNKTLAFIGGRDGQD